MTRYKIILNPTAGKGAAGRSIDLVKTCLEEHHIEYDLVLTEYAWHAAELTEKAIIEGYDVVVAVGGDGTLNEVLNGIMLSRQNGIGDAALGMIPIGRGNDFAFGMGIPIEVSESVKVLAGGFRRKIDVGWVTSELYPEGRFIGNGIGIGYDAMVGFINAKQKLGGFPGYLVAALRTMYIYQPAPVMEIEMSTNGAVLKTITQPSLMVSIMNGRRMGGGFMMTPDSLSDDGLFNLCIVHDMNKPSIIALIPRFFSGTQAVHPAVQTGQAEKITVRALQGTLPAHGDGETLCVEGKEISIKIIPQAIELVSPSPHPASEIKE